MVLLQAGPESIAHPPERLDAALKRLSAALEKLEAAAERRVKADVLRANVEEELAVLQEDRSRLAMERDVALARSISLDAAAAEVARRLNEAGAGVRAVLTALERGG
jgi:hypothetical protein